MVTVLATFLVVNTASTAVEVVVLIKRNLEEEQKTNTAVDIHTKKIEIPLFEKLLSLLGISGIFYQMWEDSGQSCETEQ